MAEIRRSSIIQKAVNDLNLNQAIDKIPSDTLDKVQLIYCLNQEYSNVVAHNLNSATGAFNIYTTSTTKDFYLTGLTASFIKDASCDFTTGSISITAVVGGIIRIIKAFAVITLTAQTGEVNITFPKPIKIDRGTSIIFNGTYTLGVMSRVGSVIGIEMSSN